MDYEVMQMDAAFVEIEENKCSCSCNCTCGFWHPIRGAGARRAEKNGYNMGESLDPPAIMPLLF